MPVSTSRVRLRDICVRPQNGTKCQALFNFVSYRIVKSFQYLARKFRPNGPACDQPSLWQIHAAVVPKSASDRAWPITTCWKLKLAFGTAAMPTTDLLKQFGLKRNPYTDRTAEKTHLDGLSMYVHSDLQGFAPSGILSPQPFNSPY